MVQKIITACGGSVDGKTLAVLGLTACERARPPLPRRDTARAAPPESVHVAVPPPRPPAWDTAAAGPALFVRGAAPSSALVVSPQDADSTRADSVRVDDSTLRGVTLELLSRSGRPPDCCRALRWRSAAPTGHTRGAPAPSGRARGCGRRAEAPRP